MNRNRKWMVAALVGLLVCFGVTFATGGATTDREQILQLERDWAQSVVTKDVAANERLIADDYLGTEPDGKRVKKADVIAEVKTDEPLLSNRLNEDDVTIRFYGQTAVVNGSENWKRKSDGKTGRWIWTDVFVKRNGKWQVVASQDLEIMDR
jgi:ketosteroid isomerase-like protein